MKLRSKYTEGGGLALAGYLLSPLSFWNDLFVNLPITYGFAFLAGLIHASFFAPTAVVVYWLTNIGGFVLIHKGILKIKGDTHKYNRKALARDFAISLVYTALILLFIAFDIVSFPS